LEAALSAEVGEGSPVARHQFAYLILSHKNVAQVEALAQRILRLSPEAHIVVHHDRKDSATPWNGRPPAQIHLVDRMTVEWGGWSIVEATLRMVRFAVERLASQWLVVLSGEHWPVVDLAAWEAKVSASRSDALIPMEALPTRPRFGRRDADANRDVARCLLRWFAVRRPPWKPTHKALGGLSKLTNFTHPLLKLEFSQRNDSWFIGVPRRRGPVRGWRLYKGSEWFACNARSAGVLLRADPRVAAWFQRSHIPDESYFQSSLHRDPRLIIDRTVVTWVPPQPPTPTPGWMLLKTHELPVVMASGAPFARKVDPDRNPDVMAAIDARVDTGQPRTEVGSR
jgi:hypothetical protein